MPTLSRPRHGSLQFYPRKRARRILPRVNWSAIKKAEENKDFTGLLGFIGYKVGMKSAIMKDLTPDSMTKNKKIAVPCTIIELPPMKIFSVRFYKKGKIAGEVLAENIEKEMKRKLKLPKSKKEFSRELEKYEKNMGGYDDIRVIVYSIVKKTSIKKRPDVIEIGIGGNNENKLNVIKGLLGKEIFASEILKDLKLVDVRGVTKGKGFQGPVKRFGINLRPHKSEKGIRKVGSIAPWHPARVTFRTPMAGQLGMFTRITHNNRIILLDKISDRNINPSGGFKIYGKIKTEFIVLSGSVQGPSKRAVLLTATLRKTKRQEKKKFEFIELK